MIRAAEPEDAPAIAEIYAHYVKTSAVTFEETAPTPDETAARIASSRLPFLVAEVDGHVRGYAYLSPYIERSAYRHTAQDSVYVAPGARGEGLGRALLEQLLTEGEHAGLREVVAIIAVTDDLASTKLHRAFGFREAGRLTSVGFKLGRWHDTLLMQRSLGSR